MKILKQYWWVIVLGFLFYFSRSKKPFFKNVKTFGDRDEEVKTLQTRLNKSLSTKLQVDGVFGYRTGAAIYVILEKLNNLNQDYLKIDQGPYGDYVAEIDVNWLFNQI